MKDHERYRYEWPNGAKIAVVMQVPYEYWEGDFLLNVVPNVPEDSVPEGGRDELGISGVHYAGRVGMWRLTELLDRYEVPAIAVCNGHMAELYPDPLKAFVDGHPRREVVAHSWHQKAPSWMFDKEGFREIVQRTVGTLEGVTGTRPVGWVSVAGQWVEETAEVLAEEGFLYHADHADTDSARVVEIGGRKIVAETLPYYVNDGGQFAFSYNPPSAFVEMFKREFDVLYREGGQVLGAVGHANIYGHGWGVSAYEECIQYALSHSDVWFATRKEIAEVVLEQYSGTVPTSSGADALDR